MQDVHIEGIENGFTDFSFRGGLTENFVFNQLKVNGLKVYYWKSKSDAEIDFITRLDEDIIPIEVKSKITQGLEVYLVISISINQNLLL